MKLLVQVNLELDASAKRMKAADILAWFAATLMAHEEEASLLKPAAGVITFGGQHVGEYSIQLLTAPEQPIYYFPQSRVF